MICKNCGTELPDNRKENHLSCPHCDTEKRIGETESPDIFITIPPDFTVTSEKTEKPSLVRVNNSEKFSEYLDETAPTQTGKKNLSPVLIPPSGPPPGSFFRKSTKGKK